MRGSLSTVIINYKRAKEEMARRQQQEIDRAAEVERRRQEQVAKAALREGNIDAAKQAMEIARTTVAPVIMNSAPVLDHSSGRKLWQIQVTDQMALVKAIAAGVMPLSAIREIDETFLKKEITKRGGLPEAWAGFMRAWQEEKLTVSRR
jgi:hypothetical protein